MVRLTLENVAVDYPIYHSSARSIRKHLAATSRVGGQIKSGSSASITFVQALRDINLDLQSGDRLGLVGHNGAGKTTLLRVLAGIYHPTAGNIRCEGLRMPLTDIQVGQDDEATGYGMILMRGLLMGSKRSEIQAKVEEIAEFSELGQIPRIAYSNIFERDGVPAVLLNRNKHDGRHHSHG